MSDNILTLIPVSPDYLPGERAREYAEELFRGMVPAADEAQTETAGCSATTNQEGRSLSSESEPNV